MKFRVHVELPEPMRGLEVPQEVVEALGGGKRPRVTITINGHSWKSRVAIMRGRYLLGLSNANRQAAGVVIGDEVEVEVEFDAGPPAVVEPGDFARALDADPVVIGPLRERSAHSRRYARQVRSASWPFMPHPNGRSVAPTGRGSSDSAASSPCPPESIGGRWASLPGRPTRTDRWAVPYVPPSFRSERVAS